MFKKGTTQLFEVRRKQAKGDNMPYCADKKECSKTNPTKFNAFMDDDLCYVADCFKLAEAKKPEAVLSSSTGLVRWLKQLFCLHTWLYNNNHGDHRTTRDCEKCKTKQELCNSGGYHGETRWKNVAT